MPMIQCDFCEKTTTKGIGERSGFGRIKAEIGRPPFGKRITIISCSEHSDLAFQKFQEFLVPSKQGE